MDKNAKIKASILKTRKKRSRQKCFVLKFKINEAKLSKKQKNELKMMFVEGKWFYNYIISKLQDKDFSLLNFSPLLVKDVEHLDKEKNKVSSTLEYIPASCKQTITAQIISSLKTIKTLRKRGFQKHGSLKFISELTSLNLRQYGITHKIRSSTTMKLQGISKKVKVSGLQQLRKYKNIEFANAKLLNTSSGYYIALTCFTDKETKRENNGKTIGLDFGCQTAITDSNGNKIDFSFGESERLKLLQKKLSRSNKGSNRRRKLIRKIRKQYQHMSNKKLDATNKFVHKMKQYEKVIIQDEQLSNWQKIGHGKKIQHSCLGLIKAKLKKLDNIIVLDKFIPTTKFCFHCGKKHNELKLWDRTFKCDCGVEMDRDVHAAQNMKWIYENLVGRDTAEFTLKEFKTSISKYQFDAENKSMDDELRRCQVFSLA